MGIFRAKDQAFWRIRCRRKTALDIETFIQSGTAH
jgi:hypothetical protein